MSGHAPGLFPHYVLDQFGDRDLGFMKHDLLGSKLGCLKKAITKLAEQAALVFDQRNQLCLRFIQSTDFAHPGACRLNGCQRVSSRRAQVNREPRRGDARFDAPVQSGSLFQTIRNGPA